MNLLMIILIVLAIWICGAICYLAWRVMPAVESPEAAIPSTSAAEDERPAE